MPKSLLNADINLSEPLPALERQLETDYKKNGNAYIERKLKETVSLYSNTIQRAALLAWPYRTTGVKNFTITSPGPLFGKAAGTDLNNYFSIYGFEPRQVASYQTKQLLWGYGDEQELKSITQWISLKPLAPPMILLHLNTPPPEAPGNVQLVVTLETDAGKIIRDTTTVSFLAN